MRDSEVSKKITNFACHDYRDNKKIAAKYSEGGQKPPFSL